MSSLTKPTATIDDLPAEMICELFKHLNLKDLAACSMVNKRWNKIYSGFKVQRLFAIGVSQKFHLHKWLSPFQLIRDEELVPLKLFGRLVDRPLLSNLKLLALDGYSCPFDLNKLNMFSQLIGLNIKIRYITDENLHLSLPKLVLLTIHEFVGDCIVSIDSPQLNVLSVLTYTKWPEKSPLEVKRPETIRKLVTNMVGSKLQPFKDVECLVTTNFEMISRETLRSLPGLKAFHYNQTIVDHRFPWMDQVNTFDRMKRALSEFLDELRVLKRTDFEFRFAGLRLTTLAEIDFGMQLERGRELIFNEYVYMKNYQLIDANAPLDYITVLDYNRLMSYKLTEKFPSCFFKKFPRIVRIEARGAVGDQVHFLWFLGSVSLLRSLRLFCPRLGQEFYDLLPTTTPLLTELVLEQEHEQQLSFDFIGELCDLTLCFIDQKLCFASLNSLIRSLAKLGKSSCRFQFEEKWVHIEYVDKAGGLKVCTLSENHVKKLETESAEMIMSFFESYDIQKPIAKKPRV